MHRVKCVCKDEKKNGLSAIYIQYCLTSQRRTLLSTGINIPFEYWDKIRSRVKENLPAEIGDAQKINKRVRENMSVVLDLLNESMHKNIPPIDFLKFSYHPELCQRGYNSRLLVDKFQASYANKKLSGLDIYEHLDDFIASRERMVTPVMLRIYRNMKTHLEEFEKHRGRRITFDQLDIAFYEQFVGFLTHDYVHKRRKTVIRGLRLNTIGKTVKEFRNFLRDRARKKFIPPVDMTGWKVVEEEIDAIYLSNAEIELIRNTDLSDHPYLERYRDDLVLGCLTGLRFADLSSLRKEDIRNGMLYVKQQKSNHWVVIPLRMDAKKILLKNFEMKCPPHTNVLFNKYIKLVAKRAGLNEPVRHYYKKGIQRIEVTQPKYKWLMSHTCRRSFCTNEFLAGTPVELIMKISGHKSVKDFYKYIRITPEEAGKKIQQLWIERGQMNTFT